VKLNDRKHKERVNPNKRALRDVFELVYLSFYHSIYSSVYLCDDSDDDDRSMVSFRTYLYLFYLPGSGAPADLLVPSQ
jgi:hypothetical protein